MDSNESKREPFQMYELEAYLGDFVESYDIGAIIGEATEIDCCSGNRYWVDDIDLADICSRHEL